MTLGIELRCERNPAAWYAREICLNCGQAFDLDAAILVALAGSEILGYVCPKPGCLNTEGRRKFAAACQRYAE